MRLFVAITPPRTVLLEVRAAVDAVIRSNGIGSDPLLRWTRPETWHITLAFYGDVADEKLGGLADRLGRVAARTTPMELSLAGAGRFGPRAVWFGVRGQHERLGRLAETAGSAARRCHIKVEERPYRPHLTLARVGGVPRGTANAGDGPVDLAQLVEKLKPFRSPGWLAGDIELFNVIDAVGEVGGPSDHVASKRYERVGHWPLTGR